MRTVYNEMKLAEMSKLPGIDGLKAALKVKFIKALKAKESGDNKAAEALLNEAVALVAWGK